MEWWLVRQPHKLKVGRLILTSLLLLIIVSGVQFYNSSIIGAQVDPSDDKQVLVSFNPTGTHIKDGVLKARFDIYLGAGSKTYNQHYVDKSDYPYMMSLDEIINKEIDATRYAIWWLTVPKHKELNPALCVFVSIDKYTTVTEITNYLEEIFNPGNLKSLDESLILLDSAHRTAAFMSTLPKLQYNLINPKQATSIINQVNLRFTDIRIEFGLSARAPPIKSLSIDIGPGATDMNANTTRYTVVDKANPSNDNGSITSFEVWANTNITGMEVATFIDEGGNTLSTRDTEAIGAVASGSKQTFGGLDMDVVNGDYLGIYWLSGTMERNSASGTGYWYYDGDALPCISQLFSSASPRAISIYGTGVEAASGTTPTVSTDIGAIILRALLRLIIAAGILIAVIIGPSNPMGMLFKLMIGILGFGIIDAMIISLI